MSDGLLLNVTYANCNNYVHFPECYYAGCHSAECRGTLVASRNVHSDWQLNNIFPNEVANYLQRFVDF
jgi:hypothetical protein